MKKPNLFIVGQQKSGTTALHYFLEQHPEVFMSRPKEVHFFCKDFHKLSRKFHKNNAKAFYETQDMKTYLNLFSKAKSEKILGDASPNYIHSRTSANQIYKFDPKAKIIIMLREPSAFVHSLHRQYVNETSEDIENFEKALEVESDRKKGKKIPYRIRCPTYLYYFERIKYAEQIKRFLKYFPRRQVKIIIFDDFKKNNAKIYKEVLRFLEIDETFAPDFKIVHGSKKPKSEKLNKIFRNPLLTNIPKSILSPRIYDKIQLKVQELLMKEGGFEPPVDPIIKRRLMKKFKSEVVKLNNLLHKEDFLDKKRDLVKEWSYNKIK